MADISSQGFPLSVQQTGIGGVAPQPPTPPPSRTDASIQTVAQQRFQAASAQLQAQKKTITATLTNLTSSPPIGFLGGLIKAIQTLYYTCKLAGIEKKLQKHEARAKAAEARVSETLEALEVAKTENADLARQTTPPRPQLYRSTEAFAQIGQSSGALKKESLSQSVKKTYLAQAHAPQLASEQRPPTAPPVVKNAPTWTGTVGAWEPQRVSQSEEGRLEQTPGSVTPTSARALGSPDLPNIYVRKPSGSSPHDRRPAVISCGVVDTDEKASQLLHVMLEARSKEEGRPLRISMHQLNSRALEGRMIDREHKHAQISEKALQEHAAPDRTSPFIAHTNNCVDAFSRFGATSDRYNPQAYQTYLQWALEDASTTSLGMVKNELEQRASGQSISGHPAQPLSKQERQLLTLMRSHSDTAALSQALSKKPALLATFLEQMSPKNTSVYRSLSILHQLMTNSSLKASARVLLELAFDREVGAISQMNCKSGLDRTGHIRALDDALSSLVQDGVLDPKKNPEEYLEFLTHAEEYLGEWNEATKGAQSPEDAEAVMKQQGPPAHKDRTILQGRRFEICYNLQTRYFDSMQRVALPITAVSTGVPGVKWHHKAESWNFQFNREPMPFLPLFAMKPKEKAGEEPPFVRLISQNGSRLFTEDGVRLLQGHATERGG